MLLDLEELAINYITYETSYDYGFYGISPLLMHPSDLDEDYFASFSNKYPLNKIDWCVDITLDDCEGVTNPSNIKWIIDKFIHDPKNYESLSFLTCNDTDLDLYLLSKVDYSYIDKCKQLLSDMLDKNNSKNLIAISQVAHQLKLSDVIYKIEKQIYEHFIEYQFMSIRDTEAHVKMIHTYIENRYKPFKYKKSKLIKK